MSTLIGEGLRTATATDAARLVHLWRLLSAQVFDEVLGEDDSPTTTGWEQHARDWLTHAIEDRTTAHVPVVEVEGVIVATAVGTLELGVPNPMCPRGRVVRLANVITVPEHRGKGFGTLLVRDVVGWARTIGADRVDLSATPDGQQLYEKVGFGPTTAPRMKMVL